MFFFQFLVFFCIITQNIYLVVICYQHLGSRCGTLTATLLHVGATLLSVLHAFSDMDRSRALVGFWAEMGLVGGGTAGWTATTGRKWMGCFVSRERKHDEERNRDGPRDGFEPNG